jgi:polar amino acid transport system substrate-binding protein
MMIRYAVRLIQRVLRAATVVFAAAVAASVGWSQDDSGARAELIIGTKQAPPFAMKDEAGDWSGISIELWRGIAAELGLSYKFREFDLQGLLGAVERGEVDAAVAALTVTAEREKTMDFSHPFYNTGLSIAVLPTKSSGLFSILGRILSPDFLKIVGALTMLLFAVGLVMWLLERKRNAAQFGGTPAEGIWSGFWWSAVTMTTVGYGDKTPQTWAGRLVAIVWMFTALVIIAGLTGAIASALTVSHFEAAVNGPEDLHRVSVGTIAGSTSEGYLRAHRIMYHNFPTVEEGLRAVAERRIDAFVYDAPLLQYLTRTQFAGEVKVLPRTFEKQNYAIAMPQGSSLREPLNRALLKRISQPEWQDTLYRYLGE